MSEMCRVGLVGRPNVGKSTLFNRLIGSRLAVVADEAGTTRDRLERVVTHGDHSFVLFDMAGIEPQLEKTELTTAIQEQVARSLVMADVLLWVVDCRKGVQPQDDALAQLFRRLHKRVVIAVNKCDDPKHEIGQYEFAQFGFEPLVTLSGLHGRGIHELMEVATAKVAEWEVSQVDKPAPAPKNDRELRLAIIGRPNVGKSTLLNRLCGMVRSVVSPEAGTTRDAVDTVVPALDVFGKTFTQWETVRIIDTAGIRRRGKIGHEIEAWSVIRTLDAVDQAEVVFFVISAEEGLVHQDLQVAEKVVDAGRAMVLLINKWDVVLAKKGFFPGTEEEQTLQETFLANLLRQAPFLHWAQVLFLSAQEGTNIEYLGRTIVSAYKSWNIRISQDELDELAEHLRHTPRLKNLQKITLEHSCPPVFHIHVEGKTLPHFSTNRYLENALRDTFEIGSTPIKIWSVTSVPKKLRVRPGK